MHYLKSDCCKWLTSSYRHTTLMLVLFACAGCNTIGTIQGRSESINKTTAGYSASAILLNILRAKEAEPLNFVSVTGVTGHDTATLSLGLPTIVVGPDRTPAEKLFMFGPNTVGASASNDFAVNVIDDPNSYAALVRPVDPATLGFLINEMHNRDIIFFLLIARLETFDEHGNLRDAYYNEPYTNDTNQMSFGLSDVFVNGFFQRIVYYFDRGLSVSVDQDFVPKSGETATAKFCYDPFLVDGSVLKSPNAALAHGITQGLEAINGGNLCKPIDKAGADATSKPNPPQNKTNQQSKGLLATSNGSGKDAASKPAIDWTFEDIFPGNTGGKVRVYTRSVFGAYRYLGEILNLAEQNRLTNLRYGPSGGSGGVFSGDAQYQMINLTHDLYGCWTTTYYLNTHWCVTNSARETKRVFALLHELFELYALPSNQQVTPTVRVAQ